MNLELLDPFRRQIPDRVISTLTLPPVLHGMGKSGSSGSNNNNSSNANTKAITDDTGSSAPSGTAASSSTAPSKKSSSQAAAAAAMLEEEEWKAVYHVAFNRRGSYVAVGYASGTVAVYDVQSRTLAALYRDSAATSTAATSSSSSGNNTSPTTGSSKKVILGNGVTSVTWSRRSRTLLAGAVGDAHVRLMDTTHPNGPEECCSAQPGTSNTTQSASTAAAPAAAQPPPSKESTQLPPENPVTAAAGNPSALLNDDSIREPSVLDENDPYWAYMAANASAAATPGSLKFSSPYYTSLASTDNTYDFVTQSRQLLLERVPRSGQSSTASAVEQNTAATSTEPPTAVTEPLGQKRLRRYPTLVFSFPHPVGGSLQIHPRETTAGLAVLSNGSLVVFWAPPWAWEEEISEDEVTSAAAVVATVTSKKTRKKRRRSDSTANDEEEDEDEDDYPDDELEQQPPDRFGRDRMEVDLEKKITAAMNYRQPSAAGNDKCSSTSNKTIPKVQLVTIFDNHHYITCAAFDPQGERIYAASKDGTLLGFEVKHVFDKLKAACTTSGAAAAAAKAPLVIPPLPISFRIHIPGGSTAWHLIVSRNGRTLVINSADGALRLYSTAECWSTPELVEKPNLVFQDIVSKVKFASCDISGDGEYVVGGANGNVDNKYELYIWNTTTGALMDKLTGPPVQLYSVAWHPTRSFLAVAASDGMVDVWGPPINWTAFAPDFQALPANVEYVEREDEFDIVAVHRPKTKDVIDDDEDRTDERGHYLPHTSDDVPVTDEDDEKKDVMDEEDYDDYENGNEDEEGDGKEGDENEDLAVDVVTVEPVPVFASDSEDEEETFTFENKVLNVKLRKYKKDLDDKD